MTLPEGYVVIRRRTKVWLITMVGILSVLLCLLLLGIFVVVLLFLGLSSMGDPLGMPDPKEPGQVELPVDGLGEVRGVATAFWGENQYLYVLDEHNGSGRVLRVNPDGTDQTELPFPPLPEPQDIDVDREGNVYVVDNASGTGHVYRLEADAVAPVELPFPDVGFIEAIAVGAEDETVYVAERGDADNPGRVLQLRSWESDYTELPIAGLVSPRNIDFDDFRDDLLVVDSATRKLSEIYIGRDLSVTEADLGTCAPTRLSYIDSLKYMTCQDGRFVVIRGDGDYVQDVEIDGDVVDIAGSNGNWMYVVLADDGGDRLVTFVEDL